MNEDEEFSKILGQFQLHVGAIMKPLRAYGQEHYVDMVIPEITSLAYQMHLKMSGIDEPYWVNLVSSEPDD